MELRGTTAVITGGSKGIGAALAAELVDRGVRVLLVARSAGALAETAERLGADHLSADLTDAADLDGLVDRCLEVLGHIDVWVNNAGLETNDSFVGTDRDTIRAINRLNLEAPMLLTRDVLPHMLARGRGHVVNLSSLAGVTAYPGLSAYCGTKAGLTNFTEALRTELVGTGVGLTVVAPGPVDTDMWERLDESSYTAPVLRRFRRLGFLPKLDPEKVARQIADAVEKERPHVRPALRYGIYHQLNNAPRRIVGLALTGVHVDPPQVPPVDTEPWVPLWPTDNPVSRRWPLYTRGNVGEVFPDVVLPLTWDVFGKRAEDGWRSAFRTLGLLRPGDLPDDEDMVILGVFGGYCYINASYVRLLGVRAPGGTVEVIDRQFFGESDAPPYRPRPGDTDLRASAALGRTVLRLLGTRELPELVEDQRLAADYVARYPGDGASDQALLDHVLALAPVFERLFDRHIVNTFSAALLLGALVDLVTEAGHEDQLVAILGGIGDVESAAPSTAMWDLAREAAATPAVASGFDSGVPGLLARLEADPDAVGWVERFRSFLDEFGSRGPNEWDIGSDPWAFRPELALAAIDRMRAADDSHDPRAQARRLASERTAAIATVRADLGRIDRLRFDKALAATTLFSQARERSKTTVIRAVHGARVAQAELARRLAERGGPSERRLTCLLTFDELRTALVDPASALELVAERDERHRELSALVPPFVVDGSVPDPSTWVRRDVARDLLAEGAVLQGIAGCPGVARGRARVVLDPADPGALGPGDVLVAPITDPSWTPLFLAAEAVVVDVGATMSHAVIVSRELGIPCVVSAVGATGSIPDGAVLEVDGNTGRVTVLEVPE